MKLDAFTSDMSFERGIKKACKVTSVNFFFFYQMENAPEGDNLVTAMEYEEEVAEELGLDAGKKKKKEKKKL